MRKFLLTKFACSVCHSNLSVERAGDVQTWNEKDAPTGGDIVEALVLVHPCETCGAKVKQLERAVGLIQRYDVGNGS